MSYIGQRKIPKGQTAATDNYLGSGTRLLYAIKKYNRKNFKKVILHECITQEDADRLEIHEITTRGALEDKTKFYNISPGGQFGRSEKHSEITSKSMSEYYANDDNYTERMIWNNRVRFLKGQKPLKYINKAQRDIDNLRKSLARDILSNSLKESKQIKKLIRKSTEHERKGNGGVAVWEQRREYLIGTYKRAHARRIEDSISNGTPYFSQQTSKAFAMAKLRTHNNLVGVYLLENGCDTMRPVEKRLKKLLGTNYKSYDNFIISVDYVHDIITNEMLFNIEYNILLDLIHQSRCKRGLKCLKKGTVENKKK